ncbi:MAG: hypothetical protein QOF51_756 [Chloroflexota bacterium]|jgi:hypothetical protein|nr:hypothetical protein [Chloroflexota bacterium]
MAKKRRRHKPGLQRCSICGSYQLVKEMEYRICMACLGLVAVKRWRAKGARTPDGEMDIAEKVAVEAG